MSKAEQEYEEKICQLEQAIAKTNSKHLKKDYSKAIRRMRAELKEYRGYMYGK